MMSKQIHICIDDSLYEELGSYVVASGQTMQNFLSKTIEHMLAEVKTEKLQNSGGYKFIDLFAGIGGMRIAFESAGAQCVYSNEWNKYSQQTYYVILEESCNLFRDRRFGRMAEIWVTNWQPCLFLRFAVSRLTRPLVLVQR